MILRTTSELQMNKNLKSSMGKSKIYKLVNNQIASKIKDVTNYWQTC